MAERPGTQDGDDSPLHDCESLIARIDSTVAALTRERARLEAQARALARSPEADARADGHDR